MMRVATGRSCSAVPLALGLGGLPETYAVGCPRMSAAVPLVSVRGRFGAVTAVGPRPARGSCGSTTPSSDP
jgi:hypothetical protein